jgi:Bax inhibitor 1
MGIAGLGLSSAPLFMMAQAVSPTIIPTALGITTAIFGGASLVAYSMPKDKMLGMGGILMGSLFGLIGLQLVGLLTSMFMGPNPLSSLLFSANNYLGIGLFSALIAYDTHVAMKMYEMR